MALTFHHQQLENGLNVLTECNPDSYSIALGLFVKTGSVDEQPDNNGVSHFLEHMVFKGSERYTCADVNRIFDEIGARYNAFTTQEMTAFYANVLPEYTHRAMEHLAYLLRPSLRQADFDTEKNVILEEIRMSQDDPEHRLWERAMSEHFGSHPLGRSILGPAETIQSLRREQMVEYFQRRYGPGNMVLAATGRLDPAEVGDMALELCGAWPDGHVPREYATPSYHSHRRFDVDPKLKRQYIMGLIPGPDMQDERRFAARILADVIGECDGSRFYWSLVDKAIADEADFGFYPHDHCGSYYLSLCTEPDRAHQALDIALAELRRVGDDLNDEEVERARNKIASSIVLHGEVPLGRMRGIGSQWLYTGGYRSLEEDMKTLEGITRQTLRDLMHDFPFEPLTLTGLGPNGDI